LVATRCVKVCQVECVVLDLAKGTSVGSSAFELDNKDSVASQQDYVDAPLSSRNWEFER
jgi:hypothetical protein